MILIDNELLDSISLKAKDNVRLRMNFNLHQSLEEPVQRMLNALEPGTVLPVHRHQNTDETYLMLRGSLNLKLYDANRTLVDTIELNPAKGKYGVSVPAGQWHTLEILEENTVLFELKQGPYIPFQPEDILPE
jgi:cupin fold WbuC family metalloprotein